MDGQNTDILIFAGSSGQPFAERMCRYLGTQLGQSSVKRFSDGNLFVRVGETVRKKDVYLVQPIGLNPNDEFVEILFWMDALRRASAQSITAIIPYFSYAKGDKKDEPRVSIRARVCADAIEMAGANRVVMMDLHAPQVQGFFRIPSDHLLALPLLCETVQSMGIVDEDLVVVSPDAGFAKQARKFSQYLGVPVAIGDKMRYGHDENAEVLEVIGQVEGKNCLIVDDFSISGGTLADLARGLHDRGAKRMFVCLSHNVMTPDGVERVKNSPIEYVISTDSVDNPHIAGELMFRTVSVAPLFAEAVTRIHSCQSVSPLFSRVPDRVVNEGLGDQVRFW